MIISYWALLHLTFFVGGFPGSKYMFLPFYFFDLGSCSIFISCQKSKKRLKVSFWSIKFFEGKNFEISLYTFVRGNFWSILDFILELYLWNSWLRIILQCFLGDFVAFWVPEGGLKLYYGLFRRILKPIFAIKWLVSF
jgi:hypothetical protein